MDTKRRIGVAAAFAVAAYLGGLALAQTGAGQVTTGAPGAYPCSGMVGRGWGSPMMSSWMMGPAATTPITEEKAKEAAQNYANTYLKGFTVDKVLPFTGMMGTMYSVELKGPKDEVRTLHVNPWGNVMPFGGAGRRAN
jgi:hypothetical protein